MKPTKKLRFGHIVIWSEIRGQFVCLGFNDHGFNDHYKVAIVADRTRTVTHSTIPIMYRTANVQALHITGRMHLAELLAFTLRALKEPEPAFHPTLFK